MTTAPTFAHRQWDEDFVLEPNFLGVYNTGKPALQLFTHDGEPFGTVTVNLEGHHLEEDEHHIKNWSENEQVVAKLLLMGWLIPTGRFTQSGFVQVPIMLFGHDLLNFYNSKEVQQVLTYARTQLPS